MARSKRSRGLAARLSVCAAEPSGEGAAIRPHPPSRSPDPSLVRHAAAHGPPDSLIRDGRHDGWYPSELVSAAGPIDSFIGDSGMGTMAVRSVDSIDRGAPGLRSVARWRAQARRYPHRYRLAVAAPDVADVV